MPSTTNFNIIWMPAKRTNSDAPITSYQQGLIKAVKIAKKLAENLTKENPAETPVTRLWANPDDVAKIKNKKKYKKLKSFTAHDFNGNKIEGLERLEIKPSFVSSLFKKNSSTLEIHPHENLYQLNAHALNKGYINHETYDGLYNLLRKTDDKKPEYVRNAYLASDIKRLIILHLHQTVFGRSPIPHYEHYIDHDVAEKMTQYNNNDLKSKIDNGDDTSRIITAHGGNNMLLTSSASKDLLIPKIESLLSQYQWRLNDLLSRGIRIVNDDFDNKKKLENDHSAALNSEMVVRWRKEASCFESPSIKNFFNIQN